MAAGRRRRSGHARFGRSRQPVQRLGRLAELVAVAEVVRRAQRHSAAEAAEVAVAAEVVALCRTQEIQLHRCCGQVAVRALRWSVTVSKL